MSIIVPALNEAGVIARALGPLQQARRAGAEVILVDGGSSDDTVAIATCLVDQVVASGSGRAAQMNAGAQSARGAVLWFIHADTRVDDECWKQVAAVGELAWGRFDLRLDAAAAIYRVIEKAINIRARISGMATGDQALFVGRALFHQVGGYAQIPLMEDLQLSRTLRGQACMISLKPNVITSARRWQENGVLRTIGLMWWLRLQWWLGVSPSRLARRYNGE